MITGFNTDIRHEGVTYHVQTEDKGLKTPLILSLVYQGGTILASKRTPYEDLVNDFDEKVLEERLNRQHNLICAAIRAGRIEDLKKMTQKASLANKVATTKDTKDIVTSKKTPVVKEKIDDVVSETQRIDKTLIKNSNPKLGKEPFVIPPITGKPILKEEESDKISEGKFGTEPEIPKPIADIRVDAEISHPLPDEKISKPKEEPIWDIPIIEDVTIVEDIDTEQEEVFAGEIILPPDAVEIVGDLEQFGSLLENELKVKILGENPFKSGDRRSINILVCRGEEDLAVSDASIMVKVIGSDFRPLIYHAKADSNGVATTFLKLPVFRSGRAAIIIRAMVDSEETELRRAISPE